MQDSILVITPQAPFGELIRQSLEETGRYRVEVVYRAVDALARCRRQGGYSLVILDGDLPGSAPAPLIQELRSALPEARIAAIPSEVGLGSDPPLPVDGTLSKPFYLPSLTASVERLIGGGDAKAPQAAPTSLARVLGWPESETERQARLERMVAAAGALGGAFAADGIVTSATGAAAEWFAGLDGGAAPEQIVYRPAPAGQGWALAYTLDQVGIGTLILVFPPDTAYSQARAHALEALRA